MESRVEEATELRATSSFSCLTHLLVRTGFQCLVAFHARPAQQVMAHAVLVRQQATWRAVPELLFCLDYPTIKPGQMWLAGTANSRQDLALSTLCPNPVCRRFSHPARFRKQR